MKHFSAKILLMSSAAFASAVLGQQAAVDAADVTVEASPLHGIEKVGQDDSIARALTGEASVTVVPQGLAGSQSDLIIRGSSFSGAGLSLFNLPLTHPQSEHFHAEIPYAASLFAAPEVQTGVAQAAATDGHLVGTIALAPLPVTEGGRITVGDISEGGYWVHGQKGMRLNDQIGLRVFGGVQEADEVDLPVNDLENARGGMQLDWSNGDWRGDLLVGYAEKTFGTTGYYGVSPSLLSVEKTDDFTAAAALQALNPENPLQISVLYREFQDDYKLELPTRLFRNQHLSRVASAQVSSEIDLNESRSMGLLWRVSGTHEDIQSNALGDFDRYRITGTLLPSITLGESVFLHAGARYESLQDFDNHLLPQARVEVELAADVTAYLEHSQTVRRPSYTELNYESPGSLGNSGLTEQTQEANELGLVLRGERSYHSRIALFERRTYNAVDWTRAEPAGRWSATDLGRVDTRGAEVEVGFEAGPLDVTLVYAVLDKDTGDVPFSSRYFLDYAEQAARVILDWKMNDHIRFETVQSWRDQVANVLRSEGGDEQLLGSAAVHLRLLNSPAQVTFAVDNMWDDDYRVFPGQDTVTNRRYSAAVTLDF